MCLRQPPSTSGISNISVAAVYRIVFDALQVSQYSHTGHTTTEANKHTRHGTSTITSTLSPHNPPSSPTAAHHRPRNSSIPFLPNRRIPTMPLPTLTLHTLPSTSTNGSATYASPTNSHTLLSAVSYPLEVSYRSRELPEDTYIEVNLVPHNGVAQVKERHVEALVARVLKSVVRGEETPRCMLQVTLQVTECEVDEGLPGGVKGEGQGGTYLEILAGAVNCAVGGCLDSGVQMRGLAGAVLVSVGWRGEVVVWPGLRERKAARSLHVFGYGRGGECLLMESEGVFGVEEWEEAERAARRVVVGVADSEDGDVEMDEDEETLFDVMRRAVQVRVEKDGRWRGE